MSRIIRVFPTRSRSYTPDDDLAFVGDPPLMRPEADLARVSCVFTWDIPKAERLAKAWGQYYPVELGGPAFGSPVDGFEPGMYVKRGIVFTSRGCENHCAWCLVPEREGRLQLIDPIPEGYVIQDNSFLQTPAEHRQKVYAMLRRQPRAAVFKGGLQASLVDECITEEFRTIRIDEVFLACDTERAIEPLREATRNLSFLRRRQLRCYVLIGYRGESLAAAERRLEDVWDAGCLPFAQLYRAPDRTIEYGDEWRRLARAYSRPAATFALHRGLSIV